MIGSSVGRAGLAGALSLVLLSAACAGSTEPAAPADPPGAGGFVTDVCADVVMIGVRGQSQSADANLGAGQEVYAVAVDLVERLDRRSTDLRLETIDYDSAAPPDQEAYDRAVDGGIETLRGRLEALTERCPRSDLVVAGFSEGASVVHGALDRPVDARLRAVAMIADPRRAPEGDVEQVAFAGDARFAGRLGPGAAFGRLAPRSLSFCHAGDNICNHRPDDDRTGSNLIHRTAYEQPDVVALIAGRIDDLLRR